MSLWRPEEGRHGGDAELSEIISQIEARSEFFDRARPIHLSRAPGRLDVMGGFADYSGSLVLELPLGLSTWVAAQASASPAVTLLSTAGGELSSEEVITIPLAALAPAEGPLDYEASRALLTADPRRAWGAYVAGVVVVLHHAYGRLFREGLKCLVHSSVPVGKGLSSSAAATVATMHALASLVEVAIDGRDLALLAQKVENLIVGAPCGVMDQMTAACGSRDHLLALLCQPAELEGQVQLPRDLELWGLDSGIRHAVSGADYVSVRVGAFMGYRIVAEEAGFASRVVPPGRVLVEDHVFGGYLANITPSVWQSRFRDRVPEALEGASFLERYQGLTDSVTRVDPTRTYAVRACTQHPIDEHHRVRAFRALLEGGAYGEGSRELLGELMYQSHESYSSCGLGSDGTDRLVALTRDAGKRAGLYGAKITGGGSGGTVAVLARAGSRPALERIARQYETETGRKGAVFGGSSDGALRYGPRKLVPH